MCGHGQAAVPAQNGVSGPGTGDMQYHLGRIGRPSSSAFFVGRNALPTDTMIDTVMDHDTQLQGCFSAGQPMWSSGQGVDGAGY